MRWFACALALAIAASAGAADRDGKRWYFGIHANGALFADDQPLPEVSVQNPSQWPFPGLTLGANLDRFWSVELAVDYAESDVLTPGLTEPGSSNIFGEYSMWSIMPQARLRYPLFSGRFVPYVVAGAGLGVGDFNDRKVEFRDFSFGGSADTTLIGGLGIGADLYVSDNVSLMLEAKHLFGFSPDVDIAGRHRTLDLDPTFLSAGLRMFYDAPGTKRSDGSDVPPPRDSAKRRWYLAFRTGGAFFTNPDSNPALGIDSPTRVNFGAGVGLNLNRNWGVEVQWDYWEPTLNAPGFDVTSEYALWELVGHVRWRYPMHGDRFVPYVVAGGGMGWVNTNDPRVPRSEFDLPNVTRTTPVGSFGGGFDWFLMHNVTLGGELRYIAPFEVDDIVLDGHNTSLDNASLLLNLQVRVLFGG